MHSIHNYTLEYQISDRVACSFSRFSPLVRLLKLVRLFFSHIFGIWYYYYVTFCLGTLIRFWGLCLRNGRPKGLRAVRCAKKTTPPSPKKKDKKVRKVYRILSSLAYKFNHWVFRGGQCGTQLQRRCDVTSLRTNSLDQGMCMGTVAMFRFDIWNRQRMKSVKNLLQLS